MSAAADNADNAKSAERRYTCANDPGNNEGRERIEYRIERRDIESHVRFVLFFLFNI